MKYTNEQIEEVINQIITDRLGVNLDEEFASAKNSPTSKYDFNLQDDLGADSIDEVEILMEVEKYFDISIPDYEAEEIKTVEKLISVIKTKLIEDDKFSNEQTSFISEKKRKSKDNKPPVINFVKNCIEEMFYLPLDYKLKQVNKKLPQEKKIHSPFKLEFVEHLGATASQWREIILKSEKHFKIVIEDANMGNTKTPQSLIDKIIARI